MGGDVLSPFGGEAASCKVEQGRFYYATPATLSNGLRVIAGVGQKDEDSAVRYKGFVALYAWEKGVLRPIVQDTFAVEYEGVLKQTRIRTAAFAPAEFPANPAHVDLYMVGKGGGDSDGVGFIQRRRFDGKTLTPGRTAIIKNPGAANTNGYPLKIADLDNDGKMEIIYGGFSGDEGKGDSADIRIFHARENGGLEEDGVKPFADLPVMMRVNAMETGDINGDGGTEIIIAGRSKEGELEYPSFAWFSKGRSYYEVIKTGFPGRLRALLAADLDNDGGMELVTGGRVDTPSYMSAMLLVWKVVDNRARLAGRYYWTGMGNTRLRALSVSGQPSRILAAGRYEWRDNADTLRWLGFYQYFTFAPEGIFPDSPPRSVDKDYETRVRSLEHLGGNESLGAGFTEDSAGKSTGFIAIITM